MACGLDSGNKIDFDWIQTKIPTMNETTPNASHFQRDDDIKMEVAGLREDFGGRMLKA